MKNEYSIHTDCDGKLPILVYPGEAVPFSHAVYFVKYCNDRPVVISPYPGQEQVWNYKTECFIPLDQVPLIIN